MSQQGTTSVTNLTAEQKVAEKIAKQKELHLNKTQNSYSEFKNARVTSCSGVLMRGGHAVALAFPN